MKTDQFDTNQFIAAALKRADTWDQQQGEFGKIVAAEIRTTVEVVGQRVYQLERENAELSKENEFLHSLLSAFDWQRISAMSLAEVEKELLAEGYTKERIDACVQKCRAMVEAAATKPAHT